MENTSKVQNLINLFDDSVEQDNSLTDESRKKIIAAISTKEELENGLGELLEKAEDMKTSIDECDKNIKSWQDSKKKWATRSKSFMEVLGGLLDTFGVSAVRAGGIKLAVSKRTALEVDEDWLINKYQMMADALQSQLPDYVKVSLAIDKTRLSAFLKTDNSMLVSDPEKIHTKETRSITIKS